MAVAQLDVPRLSTYCSLPQESIHTLLDAPTAEIVRSLLENILVKALEHNELESANIKLNVELESAVRGAESKTRVLKGSIDKGLKEATDLRQKLQAEEFARRSVETELENLKIFTSNASSEISTLNARILTLESSNRDTLSLVDSKTTACDNLAQELEAQHQKTKELRREVSSLEQSVQSASAASASAKFHEQGLQQEIESLKRTNDWLDKELKTKSEEYTKYRKEKSRRITELQRQCDEATSAIEAAQQTETMLRRRFEEVSQKADDALSRIQQMEEQAAKRDESFRIELAGANRLTELTRTSLNTERQRHQDLSDQLEIAKDDASEQIGRLSAELETEHGEREAAEARLAELEVQIEQLQADLLVAQNQTQTNQSSRQGINGYRPGTPPLGSPNTPRPKGGLSITQMYSNYNELKAELDKQKRHSEKARATLDELVQELESREPEIEEMRSENARLQSEVAEMSSLVEIVSKERDQALKGAKKWEGQVEAKIIEGEVLRQQLRDLSSQVKVFLMEVHLRDQGVEDISEEGRAQLNQIAQGLIDGEAVEGSNPTAQFISAELVTFRNISELQEQNTKLLKITREVGDRLEHEEALRKQAEDARDWEDLQQKYERCKDEIRSLVTQSQSYIRERDMFRHMLAHRGQLLPGSELNSTFGESVTGDGGPTTPQPAGVMNSIQNSPTAKDLADYAKLYKDMQAHFDAYRNEAATDRSTLKEQLDGISRLNGELRTEVARSNSQVTLAQERYEMLNANYSMLKTENMELQKRSQYLSENAAKQEMRTQQVAEDLVEAKGLIDSMRNETANLKAEKELWKTVEKRVTEDNESLLNERTRLNALNANLQSMLNEREHSDTDSRRRMQTQLDNLENELQTTKATLSDETEENKRLAQRREYDHEQSQKRIDDLVASLGSIREQLIAANTTKEHLSTRVDELTIELRSAEERVHVLQPLPTTRSNVTNGNGLEQLSVDVEESGLSKEQELAVEVSELRRDLDLARTELENVKGQVEQYKAISQASEDELVNLNETQELYRQDTDKLIEEKDAKIKKLEQRVEDTSSELVAINTELLELRNEQAEKSRRLDEQKKAFETELAQLKDEDERHAAAANFYQEDLKAQVVIAQQAQQNYERELIKHGDAAKALQKVRADYNELKLETVEVKADAESARTSLRQSEESWMESRERYERELAELRANRENLTAQNNRLHQQLESVTGQISTLRKRASSGGEAQGKDFSGSNLDNLSEVIKYLRHEKEIVDVQLELSAQEGKRLKQQLDYTQSQLDDTRLRLNQQMRVEADTQRTRLEHNKLMETLNELNTFRESSVTLRAESRQAQAALTTRTKEVEELTAQIEPLKAHILELKNERENQEAEMKLLEENSARWQQRAQNVLQKYDRVDPAELEALKEQVKSLEAERDELLSSRQSLQEQAANSATQMNQAQDQTNEKLENLRARLGEQFKARSKQLSDKIKERDSALQTAVTEKESLEQRLASLSGMQQELDTTRAERDAAMQKADTHPSTSDVNAQDGSEDGQVTEGETTKSPQADLHALQEKLVAAEARAAGETSEAASLRNQLDASRSRIAELEAQIDQMQKSIDAYKAELTLLHISQQQQANIAANGEAEEQMRILREDLAQALQDADNLRTAASVNASLANTQMEDGPKSIAEQVSEHVGVVRAELEARHNERVKQAHETLEKRTNVMKANLTKKLTEGKNQIRQSLAAEHDQALQALRTEHEQELERLRRRHRDELDELQRNENSRFAKARENWEKEHHGDPNVKGEDHAPRGPWEPSETEIRGLLQRNEMVRGLLRKNVNTQVHKVKEELNAEHEKSLAGRIAEVQSKSETAKSHAVLMEGKKNALQVNMATNKLKIAQFKVDIVEKAAKETPMKPVQEVWLAIKDAKPPPSIISPPTQDVLKSQKPPVASTFGQPTPFGSKFAQQNPAAVNTQEHINPFAPNATQQKPAQSNAQIQGALTANMGIGQANKAEPSGVSTFGRPTPAGPSPQTSSPTGRQSPAPQSSLVQPAQNSTNTSQQVAQQAAPSQPGSNPSQRSVQGTANQNPNAGTGPGALKGVQQSGLPVARGGSIRGRGIVRGGGSGIGRGGAQPINMSGGAVQPQGRGSPTSGLNAGAKQFVPGNKRPRDENQDGQQGSDGKRVRGGGVGP